MTNIALVHYLPIELYPPVINLLDVSESYDLRIRVFTTNNNKGRKTYQHPSVQITRFAFPGSGSAISRIVKYLWFNFGVLLGLIRLKPKKILYFETHSSYPVYLYKKYFNQSVEIYIHCHEYYDPGWYLRYTKLLRHYHAKEKSFLYRDAKWISQTNKDRMNFFLKDHPFLKEEQLKILPNYPPGNWQTATKREYAPAGTVRCVYVGSLSKQTTYIQEFCEWVIKQQGKISFDIYSFNCDRATSEYLSALPADCIRFFPDGVEYENIPGVLSNYDVGVMLYKAETLNVKYCAPNKLFEYLVCGLDVWFSEELIGCYGFIDNAGLPKIVKISFMELHHFDYRQAIKRDGLKERELEYSCNEALRSLLTELSANAGKKN